MTINNSKPKAIGYIFEPLSFPKGSKERKIALITSIAVGILTLGILHGSYYLIKSCSHKQKEHLSSIDESVSDVFQRQREARRHDRDIPRTPRAEVRPGPFTPSTPRTGPYAPSPGRRVLQTPERLIFSSSTEDDPFSTEEEEETSSSMSGVNDFPLERDPFRTPIREPLHVALDPQPVLPVAHPIVPAPEVPQIINSITYVKGNDVEDVPENYKFITEDGLWLLDLRELPRVFREKGSWYNPHISEEFSLTEIIRLKSYYDDLLTRWDDPLADDLEDEQRETLFFLLTVDHEQQESSKPENISLDDEDSSETLRSLESDEETIYSNKSISDSHILDALDDDIELVKWEDCLNPDFDTVLWKHLKEVPRGFLFKASDNYSYDIREIPYLYQKEGGLINPWTHSPFSDDDLDRIRAQITKLVVGEKFQNASSDSALNFLPLEEIFDDGFEYLFITTSDTEAKPTFYQMNELALWIATCKSDRNPMSEEGFSQDDKRTLKRYILKYIDIA